MKEHSDNGVPNPRNEAGFLSVLFFTYTLDIFKKGHFWNVSNLYKPLDSHRSERLGETLERLWTQHREECRISGRTPNISIVLFRMFWCDISMDSSLLILSSVPRIVQPLSLGNILVYFSSTNMITKSDAYWYIMLLVIFNLMSTIVSVQYKFSCSITALKIRIACSTCIHRKILRMGAQTSNNALNLISNDLSRFDRSSNYVHYVWGSPLFLISISNSLYYDVGISGLVGVVWFILYMFLQSFFARWIGSYRNAIAKKTDARIKAMSEILSSIKVIKMYAWEKPFCDLVKTCRKLEMKIVKKVTYFKGILYSLQAFVNLSAIFFALLTMVVLHEEITAPKVFKSIMYYYSFNFAITLMFPSSVTKTTELHQILKRINEFLLREEVQESRKNVAEDQKDRIVLENCTVQWQTSRRVPLNGATLSINDEELLSRNQQTRNCISQNVNLKLQDWKMIGVTGAVGSGKTTLLSSILGETKTSGHIHVNGSVSYSSQEPWFFSGTIKQNILFDQISDKERYSEVIRVCGLKTDLDSFPEKDKTLLGECGISLSGGQKSRINLARAIYRKAGIYSLDDPLSSVDVGVANHVMQECLMGFSKDKCRILVTHNVNHLKNCDNVVVIKEGRSEKHYTSEKSESYLDEDFRKEEVVEIIETNIPWEKCEKLATKYTPSKEEKEKKSNIFTYLTSGNNVSIITLVSSVFIFTQASESFIFLFISYWTHIEEINRTTSNVTEGQQMVFTSGRYLYLFVFLGVLAISSVSSISRAVTYSVMVMRSSNTLHNRMSHRVIRSEMSFFETVDIGQILSRFSKDSGAVDEISPRTIMESCIVVFGIFARISLIGYVNPYLIIVVLAFAAIFSNFIRIFVYTSKNLKRIEGKLMGPVLTQVRSTMEGLATVRASKAQPLMEREFCRHQDAYTSSCYMFSTVTHAFSFAVEFITTIFISIVTFSCFLMEEKIRSNGSQIGLAITQSMAFTTYLQFCIIQCVQANNHLVAVERIREYEDLPQVSTSTSTEEVVEDWPKFGSISFKNVQVSYNGEQQPVLEDLNFDIKAGEKVGIIGRTGGGKSSSIASILKLTKVKGEISIDSQDIQKIPSDIVRSRISVIPQDPVSFSGTLRFNSDPLGQCDDHVSYQSLKEVGWFSNSLGVNNSDDQIVEMGANLSIGQKQSICLARTIVRRNKMVLIDEATSNMDIETDSMMQQVIRKQFKDCTVLTIAHRLSTVSDYDKIMVIECGRLIEYSSPDILLKDNKSKLYKMMHETNK